MQETYFSIPKHISFKTQKNNFPPFIMLTSPHSQCSISLYGGQVLSFIPKNHPDILWLSEKAFYQEGKAIRGGIPLCFPWFASEGSPAHGFARIMTWEVIDSGIDNKENPYIKLKLEANEHTKYFWDFKFSAELLVKVSQKLEINFSITNEDEKSFSFTEALHSYFQISSIENITLRGLEDCSYIDSLDNNISKVEENAIVINAEIDRIYQDNENTCIIIDKKFNRKITISKVNSHSTVVWNPWIHKSSTMKDMQKDAYKHMFCVESANVGEKKVLLKSGETHTLQLSIEVSSP